MSCSSNERSHIYIIYLLVLFMPLQTYAQVVNFKDIDSVFVKKNGLEH